MRAALVSEQAMKVQRIGMIGMNVAERAVKRIGLIEAAGAVMFERLLEVGGRIGRALGHLIASTLRLTSVPCFLSMCGK
jgi:NAD/NADP transhydrogenase beta subunit